MRKPTVSVWAVNQLRRQDPAGLADLLQASDELVEGQKQALARRGSERFAEASRRHQELVRRLVTKAAGVLGEGGTGATQATAERIATTLRAAAVDPGSRRLLESGRLQQDLEPTGFELLASFPAPRSLDSDTRRQALREAGDAVKQARAEAREKRRLAASAGKDAEDARRTAERLAAEAETANAQAEEAEEAVRVVERALDDLR
ncbi:MAG: hypothetical protein ACRDN6_10985 [Gaiellaceae bacterium]